ncbi:uncharacterized protein LOC129179363 isoform X2 [Dunckerocampus dactyliophorus]|uniref:uncharacterized protein LOC129179363 isoform X2 n=1 Tax=Dunckerocampus dactyliophorus TaxID=161453 RepID=UPI00240703B8|nr:uncharacterized protein LOC129179363 isoform X2 [Dunckerocampus dactyliophorus]
MLKQSTPLLVCSEERILQSPDTVDVYKLDNPTVRSPKADRDDIYLPAIPRKASSLTSVRGSLSQSCPYLSHLKRRGSFSSVSSQRAGGHSNKQSYLNVQKEAKKSNVTVTMTYLGQGHRGSRTGSIPDELKVLQQVNGGENICVFKGLVTPGEQFKFVSQRHRGFPFSASMYANGITVARISSCCEYRYAPGFQQGKKSCFRLSWLAGGIPCHRCTSLRSKYSSCQQLKNTQERLVLPLVQSYVNVPITSPVETCPSSPLFIPLNKSARRTRRRVKDSSSGSTDNEGPRAAVTTETSKKKRHKGQTKQSKKTATSTRGEESSEVSRGSTVSQRYKGQTSSARQENIETTGNTEQLNTYKTGKVLGSLQDEEVLTKQKWEKQRESNGKSRDGDQLRDFYEECMQMSAALEKGPNKHSWFQANLLQRRRLHKRLSFGPKAPSSDVELSAESDSVLQPDGEKEEEKKAKAGEEESAQKQNLQAQLDAMIAVLSKSDEVEQLVLRNTDLTDDLLLALADALKSSSSEVTLLNLNLNLIGPYGAHILLDVLRVKPQIRGLHLFGNRLRDHGVLTLLSGIAELQEQTSRVAVAIHQAALFPSEQHLLLQQAMPNLTTRESSFKVFTLLELDLGGNNLSGDGVKVLASYMRHHSHLQYLGLAQTGGADLAAWKELFHSLRGNSSLTQIILDENNLGDPGVRLLADVLKVNASLQTVDLDGNGISDVGGNDLMAALLCRGQFPMRHLSLAENKISSGLMSRIQEELNYK